MKYLITLIIPLFIFSCSMEKEETDYVDALFSYTTASVNIDNVNGVVEKPVCMNFFEDNSTVNYTIKSKGHYGSNSVDPIIRDSEIRISRAKLYFNNQAVEIPTPSNIKYNGSITQPATVTKDMIDSAGITDGTYTLSIEMVAGEYNGNNISTVLNKTFSSDFGEVIITSDGTGCGN